MRIDRTRFLALTAALAACNSQPPATPGTTLEIPATVAQSDVPDASAGEPDASASLYARRDSGAPSEESDANDACAAASAQGTPADCSLLKMPTGAPQCESFDDTVEECDAMKRLFKPAVAEKATKCLLAKSGTRAICQFGVAAICASNAFRTSCGDPATLASCKAVVQKCSTQSVSNVSPRVTVSECQGALAAVAAKNRPALLSCMNEGCTAGYCFAYLK